MFFLPAPSCSFQVFHISQTPEFNCSSRFLATATAVVIKSLSLSLYKTIELNQVSIIRKTFLLLEKELLISKIDQNLQRRRLPQQLPHKTRSSRQDGRSRFLRKSSKNPCSTHHEQSPFTYLSLSHTPHSIRARSESPARAPSLFQLSSPIANLTTSFTPELQLPHACPKANHSPVSLNNAPPLPYLPGQSYR